MVVVAAAIALLLTHRLHKCLNRRENKHAGTVISNPMLETPSKLNAHYPNGTIGQK